MIEMNKVLNAELEVLYRRQEEAARFVSKTRKFGLHKWRMLMKGYSPGRLHGTLEKHFTGWCDG